MKNLFRSFFSLLFIFSFFLNPILVLADEEPSSEPTFDASDIADGTIQSFGGSSTVGAYKESQTTAQGINKLASTDNFSGAFLYNVPIEVPAGRNNLTPNINLNYNSNNKSNDSYMGYGWSFDIPTITRLNKTGSEKIYDENNFTSSMSGELVSISTTQYGPRIENGEFLKYEFNNNVWTVTDKNGTVYKYGNTTQARKDDPNDATRIYEWMLEEVRDTNDNFIRYEYFKDSGQIYPSKIFYTGHGSTDGIFEIDFNKTTYDMSPHMYYSDFAIKTNYKITDIEIKQNSSWIKKYEFDYNTGDNGYRQLLESVTESGRDILTSSIVTKNPTTFSYKTKGTIEWVEDTSWALPYHFYTQSSKTPTLMQVRDVNGDAYPDLIYSSDVSNPDPSCYGKKTFLNNGDGTWTEATCPTQWTPSFLLRTIIGSKFNDSGFRMFDYNGDFLVDAVRSYSDHDGEGTPDGYDVYKNTLDVSTPWSGQSGIVPPIGYIFGSGMNADNGVQNFDFNGDGISDSVYSWLDDDGEGLFQKSFTGDGFGWSEAQTDEWVAPYGIIDENPLGREIFTFAQWMDFNGDGLLDYAFKKHNHGTNFTDKVYVNNGHTWIENNDWILPSPTQTSGQLYSGLSDGGIRTSDVNGDGLVDIVQSNKVVLSGSAVTNSALFVNTLDENKSNNSAFVLDSNNKLPITFANEWSQSSHSIMADINADGMDDLIYAEIEGKGSSSKFVAHTYIAQVTPFTDMLVEINTPEGATSNISYKLSTQYFDSSGDILNPNLPVAVTTVSSVETDDGLGHINTEKYIYEDGHYYYNNPQDRRFAGFGIVTKEDSVGNITKTYHHQGNDTNSSMGEYYDHSSKIGKVYRQEIYDNTNNLFEQTVNKWDKYNLGTGRDFVKQVTSVFYNYDGEVNHKDKAELYNYDNINGNLLEKIEYGEVLANNDGTYFDIGSDKRTTEYTYASSTTSAVKNKPSEVIVKNNSGIVVGSTRYEYDHQPLGGITRGNKTKESNLISGYNFSDTKYDYDNYGLVLSEYNPNNKLTSYVYDSYNMYPVLIINPLLQQTAYQYNYLNGKPIQITDPNNVVFINTYDGLGRIKDESGPDPITGMTIYKKSYSYNDLSFPNSVTENINIDSGVSHKTYTYFDGLGRMIQKKIETEGDYSTTDYIYNDRGLLYKDSLPYSVSSSSYSSPTTNNNLLETYAHDALGRIISITDITGSVTNTYTPWQTLVTDQLTNKKLFTEDAYGNIKTVGEYIGGTTIYNTNYEWDTFGNLNKIIDSLGNIRNFTYDGLNRRLTAEDLHDPIDTFFGVWSYTYDNAGNITNIKDPKNQNIAYTYDSLNRVLTENYTSTPGSDISYIYDSCLNGKGKICSTQTSVNTDSFEYTKDGQVNKETRTIATVPYVTEYKHNYQGTIKEIKYPDSSLLKYDYNSSNKIENINYKPSTISSWTTLISDLNYGPHGKITQRVNANGVTTSYTYNANDIYRMSDIDTVDLGTNNIQDISYTYDNVGNITSISDTSTSQASKSASYVYDDLYRLTSATITNTASGGNYTHTYSYNQIGNILTKADNPGTYTYDGNTILGSYANPHAITSLGSVNYNYDKNGNLINDSSGISYLWNYRNRLTNTNLTSPAMVIGYEYDQNDNRIKYQTPTDITIYPNKLYNIKNGTDITKHIFLGDTPVITIEKMGTIENIFYNHQDHLGSTNVITDSSGTLAQTLDYYPYGTQRISVGSQDEQRKYIGQAYDEDTQTSYLNARYYQGARGQFISQDPVFRNPNGFGTDIYTSFLNDPQNQNSYSYARNNPINRSDPSGLNWCCRERRYS